MTRREKLLAKIRQNPKNVPFAQLDRLLRDYGFELRKPSGGSHYVYVRGPIQMTVPYRRPHLKEHYVKRALELIEEITREEPA